MGNITEHPNSALRREVEELKLRVKLLEASNDSTTRAMLVVIQKHEELRDLVIRTLNILNKIEKSKAVGTP